MFHGKPILGVAGGIGSGKSFVARCFEPFGWIVINSDQLGREVYGQPEVRDTLRAWWGESIFDTDGQIQRSTIAKIIFHNPAERRRLEALIHPAVKALRERRMLAAADDPDVVGFVWDSPLLFESGLAKECDGVVYVDAPIAIRQARVSRDRGWAAGELDRREISQMPLDTKRKMSQDVIRNDGEQSVVVPQIRRLLSRLSERLNVKTFRLAGDA